MKYPVFDPDITEKDISFVVDALSKGEISGNFGSYLENFEKEYAEFCGVAHGIAVTSGTTALQLALAVMEFEPGSEVLISSSTNIATALAVLHNQLVPVPVDSEMETWNLDLQNLRSQITSRTKAIIPVHLFGHPVQMEQLMEIANEFNLVVIEDCAESHGATVNGKMTGSFGQMACFSFYANKIITTGEGGMVITNDENLAIKLRKYRNLGFGQPRFVHEVPAFNFRMTGYQAALGLSQLQRIDETLVQKRELAKSYLMGLRDCKYLELPKEEEWAKHVYWMFPVLVSRDSPISRDILLKELGVLGIETRTFFCPMDLQPVLTDRYTMASCPNARDIWDRGFYLPSSTKLSRSDLAWISSQISNLLS